MIHIVSEITTAPGQRAAVLELFKALAPTVRAEAGCIAYQACVDAAGLPRYAQPRGEEGFVVLEQWADMDAFRAHVRAPHMAGYATRMQDLIVRRVLSVLEPAT